ncbi:MAG TPA: type IV pilin protein [Steroidobacteraceae bacterium]|jgi:type IV pilus assembly protein PilE|nr:type IV pilin protein [Steroidobacteraceae bacterium]
MRNAQRGFTMIELVVAMTVIGILVAVAIPSYNSYTLKSHRTDAIRSLTSLRQALERCYSQNFTYVNAVTTPCPAAPGTAVLSANNYYSITYPTLAATSYSLLATAIGIQTKDGACATFTIDSTGKQASTGTGTTQTCWGSN